MLVTMLFVQIVSVEHHALIVSALGQCDEGNKCCEDLYQVNDQLAEHFVAFQKLSELLQIVPEVDKHIRNAIQASLDLLRPRHVRLG